MPKRASTSAYVRPALELLSATASKPSRSCSLSPADLKEYQLEAIQHVLDHPHAMLWLDVGLGKTVVSLSAIALLQDMGYVSRALVVAPKRVAQTVWAQEAARWSHTRHLRVSVAVGTAAERNLAFSRSADVYAINSENIPWLLELARRRRGVPPWNMIVLDEVTYFKTSTAARSRCLATLSALADRRVGLTGEPAANGYPDLFGQYRVVDGGARLGLHVTDFRNAYLRPHPYGYGWTCPPESRKRIQARIHDITLEQSALEHLGLPEVRRTVVQVDLPPETQELYTKFEADAFAELGDSENISAASAAACLGKLVQIASGAVYLGESSTQWREVHQAKLDALEEILEESGGRPILLGHTYRHEAERILKRFPSARSLSSDLSELKLRELLRDWEADRIPLLIGHPRSMGHGLNLQGASARTVVWFGLPWSLELRNQLEGRLFGGHRRRGESSVVEILARGTADDIVQDALAGKIAVQDALKRAVAARLAR
jgi:SNF2 family DNA or RNA helicase